MKERVAILTTFQDFNPGYSLTGIVSDQYRMLKEHGHEVDIFTCTQFNHKSLPPGFKVKTLIPFAHLKDYTTKHDLTPEHKTTMEETSAVLQEELKDTQIDLTHDFLFTGWNLPYGLGVLNATHYLPDTRFLHWIHSVQWHLPVWRQRCCGSRALYRQRLQAALD